LIKRCPHKIPKALQTKISKITYWKMSTNKIFIFYRVPPAFSEIRKPVLEGKFQELKENAQKHTKLPISDLHKEL